MIFEIKKNHRRETIAALPTTTFEAPKLLYLPVFCYSCSYWEKLCCISSRKYYLTSEFSFQNSPGWQKRALERIIILRLAQSSTRHSFLHHQPRAEQRGGRSWPLMCLCADALPAALKHRFACAVFYLLESFHPFLLKTVGFHFGGFWCVLLLLLFVVFLPWMIWKQESETGSRKFTKGRCEHSNLQFSDRLYTFVHFQKLWLSVSSLFL